MSAEDKIELDGHVIEALRGSIFKVRIDERDHVVTCTLAGRLRMNNIRILVGDKVRISMSPYDLEKGTITWRYK